MSSEWNEILLADILETVNTGLDAIRRAPIVEQNTGIKCLRIQDISQSKSYLKWGNTETNKRDYDKYQLKKNDIIMARTCSPGICLLVKQDVAAVFNNGLARIRVKSGIVDPDFLHYVFKSKDFIEYIYGISHGTSVQLNMKVGDLTRYRFLLPQYSVQLHIAKILVALDDRIALLRETNVTLEAIAQALFKSWFVDFDPVRAKQEGREPEGMDADTAALFPDSFEESELGLVPNGWGYGTLVNLAELNPESWTLKTHPETVNYIDLAGAKSNEINIITEYSFAEAPSRARRVLREGDSIIGTVRPGNRSFAYIYQTLNNLTGSTGFAVLRPNAIRNREFVFIAATQDTSIDHLAHVADGGAYPAVRPEVVADIQTIIPNGKAIEAFHEAVEPIFAKVGENHFQAQTLSSIRDTLLPRLISGQLRLPEAEEIIEEATA